MIILIAPEQDIPNEQDILQQLFDAGLTHFHFRKPQASLEEHHAYLDLIDARYYKHIVPHYYHELTREYRLKGVHLQEQFRWDQGKQLTEYVQGYVADGFTVSSSYHDLVALAQERVAFDYQLLSPVFSSISKKGYEGKGFDVNHIDRLVIGMGGVNATNIPALFDLGYKGVGVLGGVWNSDDPVGSFREIKEAFERNTVFLNK